MQRTRLSPASVRSVADVAADARTRKQIETVGRALELEPAVLHDLLGAYVPLCDELGRRRRALGRPLLVGVSGAQGSGKTTLHRVARILLEGAGWSVSGCSIDDFYLGRAARRRLSSEVHPLLETRGVPGTHEVPLGVDVLRRLLRAGPGDAVPLPRFDKAVDDRVQPDAWRQHRGPSDLVIFEGWCVGAPPERVEALTTPINALEQTEDPDGTWRRYVNERLATDYAAWFAALDVLIFLAVPGFAQVRAWRRLQEEKLARARPGAPALMDAPTLERFLMHYERITVHALEALPRTADIVCTLDPDHRVTTVEAATA